MQSWLKCTQYEVGNSLQIVFRSPLPESKLPSSPSGKQRTAGFPASMNTHVEKANKSKIRFHSKAERILPSTPFPMSSDAFYEEYGYLENAPERSDRPSHRVKEAGQEVVERKYWTLTHFYRSSSRRRLVGRYSRHLETMDLDSLGIKL